MNDDFLNVPKSFDASNIVVFLQSFQTISIPILNQKIEKVEKSEKTKDQLFK